MKERDRKLAKEAIALAVVVLQNREAFGGTEVLLASGVIALNNNRVDDVDAPATPVPASGRDSMQNPDPPTLVAVAHVRRLDPSWPYSSKRTYDLIQTGGLTCVRIGRRIFLRRADLDAFINAHVVTETGGSVHGKSKPDRKGRIKEKR